MVEDHVDGGGIKNAICHHWLQPVKAEKYPKFRAWVLYSNDHETSWYV